MISVKDAKDLIKYLSAEEMAELDRLISPEIWVPLPGPQTEAYYSQADELFYGGSAGGGKTDLLLGLGLTQHYRSIIFRREAPQLQGIYDRLHQEILHSRDGFNSQDKIQRLPVGRQIEFGSAPHLGDEVRYQGRPHDLKGFDEITHWLYSQYIFLSTWLRTTRPGQRCRIVCTGNPPTSSDGEWVIKHWGPWLDPLHPNPAKPGELRWYAMIDGVDTPVADGTSIVHGDETIQPKSRTFIPSRVTDNIYLMETGYKATLQALPEPLRSQMLDGDFLAGLGDNPWQVIPTGWVDAAMARWTEDGRRQSMDSIGLDPSRGGIDTTDIARRHGYWFDKLLEYPGSSVPDGPTCASLVVSAMRDRAPIHVDVIGIGSSVYDFLNSNNIHVIPINGAQAPTPDTDDATDRTKTLKLRNMRSVCYWRLREGLDPKNNYMIALPPDPELKADLCAHRWKLTPGGILIESKEEVIKRIGRSPGKGDAVVYAYRATPKRNIGTKRRRRIRNARVA